MAKSQRQPENQLEALPMVNATELLKDEGLENLVQGVGSTSLEAIGEKRKEPKKAPEVELTKEQKVVNFLEDKDGYFKLNDFLKSLYPLPTTQEPARWLRQDEMKALKGMLVAMESDGLLTIKNSEHLKLGRHYYEGEQQLQRHYNLSNVTIEAKI